MVHISSGDLFRQHQERGTALGLEAQAYMRKGRLVPDEITIAMVIGKLLSLDGGQGYLLDGFPRNVVQAEALDEKLQDKELAVQRVLYLRVPEEETIRRLSKRLVCRRCQDVYHLDNSPPKVPGVCDQCGGELYRREDDRPEALAERLRVYHSQTAPLVDYYRKQGRLVEVNGLDGVEEVHARLVKALQCDGGIA